MEAYQYQPLPLLPSKGIPPPVTRLLTLRPGNPSDSIHCSLFIANVQSTIPYEALSYTWGLPSNSEKLFVLCDNRAVSITPNLDGVLRVLRHAHQERVLWVDAICIDQGNVDERGRQVGYMRLVYKHASRVVVWLGPKSEGVEQAFDLARRVALVGGISGEAIAEGTVSISELLGMSEDEFAVATFYLSEFFDREYFVRTWCVQEIVASNNHVAKCDEHEANLIDLLSTLPYILHLRGQMFPGKPLEFWNLIALNKSAAYPSTTVEGSMGKLLILLAGTRDFKATNPRDKIFGLFGISDEGLEPHLALTGTMGSTNSTSLRMLRGAAKGIAGLMDSISSPDSGGFGRNKALIPDYNKSIMEVYRDLTRFQMRASPRVLDVLSHVQHMEDPTTKTEFPSWVPKWYEPRSVSVLGGVGMFLAGFCDGHYRYFADIHDNSLVLDPAEPNKLKLDGFKIDRVTQVTAVMDFQLHDVWTAEQIWKQLFPNIRLFPQSENERMPLYKNGERLDVAFCLTATVSPLGNGLGHIRQAFLKGAFSSLPGTSALPLLRNQARYDASSFLLHNTPLDTTHLPHYSSLNDDAAQGNMERFLREAKTFTYHRRFYITRLGFIGIGPMMMRPGDEVCVLFGGRAPFILRPMGNHHIFIGDAYIRDEDIMWGKATENVKKHGTGAPVVTFELR